MKKAIVILILLTGFSTYSVNAQGTGNNTGVGAILGDPTGVSLAHWTSDNRAFSAGAAWYLRGEESLHLHVDYLFYRFDLIQPARGALPLYFGLGGRVRFDHDDNFGVRFPLGMAYHFDDHPLELFLEIAPVLELVPGTKITGNSGIGIRYYF